MSIEARQIEDQKLLLRLRKLREDKARIECERLREIRDERAAKVKTHEAHLARLVAERSRLMLWTHDAEPAALVNCSQMVEARCAQLFDRIEKTEYLRDEAQEQLAEAETGFQAGHESWMQACAQTRSVEEWLQRSRRSLARDLDRRAEREQDTGTSTTAGSSRQASVFAREHT